MNRSPNTSLRTQTEKLKNSKYGTSDALDHITRRFDETTKRLFRDSREMQFVPFGSPLDKVGLSCTQESEPVLIKLCHCL